MKKTAIFLCVVLLGMFAINGCRLIRIEEEPRKPLEYVIAKKREIPEKVQELIEEKKDQEFQMTYREDKNMYLIKGYGQQISGGFSIRVEEVSLSSNAIFFKTRLLGPEDELTGTEPSYPYIVVKIAARKEPVEFL